MRNIRTTCTLRQLARQCSLYACGANGLSMALYARHGGRHDAVVFAEGDLYPTVDHATGEEMDTICRSELRAETTGYIPPYVLSYRTRGLLNERLLDRLLKQVERDGDPELEPFQVTLTKSIDAVHDLDGAATACIGRVKQLSEWVAGRTPPMRFDDALRTEFVVLPFPITQHTILDAIQRRYPPGTTCALKLQGHGSRSARGEEVVVAARGEEEGAAAPAPPSVPERIQVQCNYHLSRLITEGAAFVRGAVEGVDALLVALIYAPGECHVQIAGGSRRLGETPLQCAQRHTSDKFGLDVTHWHLCRSLGTGIQIFMIREAAVETRTSGAAALAVAAEAAGTAP